MGILDDIKNIKPLPEHKWTLEELLKIEKKLLKKSEKSLLKELMKKDNNSIKCDISTKDDYNSIVITTPNGCTITINKDNINDFIMTDDDVSKVVEILKKQIIVKNNDDIKFTNKDKPVVVDFNRTKSYYKNNSIYQREKVEQDSDDEGRNIVRLKI